MAEPKTREQVIEISNRTADANGISRLLLLACGIAEGNLRWNARRPTTPAQDATFWPDVSGGPWQQTVRYDPDYRGGNDYPGPEETARILELQYDAERSANVAARQLKSKWNGEQNDDAYLRAMYLYNWPAGGGRPFTPAHRQNYERGLAEAKVILGGTVADVTPILQRVIELGRLEIGKRYAGPVIGEPDSYRWGDPGWDCSSFVSAMYDRATDGQIKLTPYTESAYTQCEWMQNPQPGDIVFYHYSDSQGIHWPHMGIWLSRDEVLDARFAGGPGSPNSGVGVHPHVTPVGPDAQGRYRQTMRPKGLASIVVAPPVTPPASDELAKAHAEIDRLNAELAAARTRLGYASVDIANAMQAAVDELRRQNPAA